MGKVNKCMDILEELINISGTWYDTLKDIAEQLEEQGDRFEKLEGLMENLPNFSQSVDEANSYFAEICVEVEG